MLEEVVANTVRAALAKIHKSTEECSQPKEEEQALERVFKKINQGISKNMSKYEDLLQKHLAIPDYVILPDNKKHDINKNKEVSESDIINMQIQSKMLEAEVAEVMEIWRQIKPCTESPNVQISLPLQTAKCIRSLEEELARYEKIKPLISDAESMFDVLASRMDENVQTTAQRNSIKHIEKLITEKNDRCK